MPVGTSINFGNLLIAENKPVRPPKKHQATKMVPHTHLDVFNDPVTVDYKIDSKYDFNFGQQDLSTEFKAGYKIATRETAADCLLQSNEMKKTLGVDLVPQILNPYEVRREYVWDILTRHVLTANMPDHKQFLISRFEK